MFSWCRLCFVSCSTGLLRALQRNASDSLLHLAEHQTISNNHQTLQTYWHNLIIIKKKLRHREPGACVRHEHEPRMRIHENPFLLQHGLSLGSHGRGETLCGDMLNANSERHDFMLVPACGIQPAISPANSCSCLARESNLRNIRGTSEEHHYLQPFVTTCNMCD